MSDSNGAFPEPFKPSRPCEVAMIFDRFEVGTTRDGDDKPIAVGEIDGRERSLWLLTTALRNQFRKLDPQEGELVRIEFAGKKREAASGRNYYDDRVSAPDRPTTTVTTAHPAFRDEDEEVDDHGTVIGY